MVTEEAIFSPEVEEMCGHIVQDTMAQFGANLPALEFLLRLYEVSQWSEAISQLPAVTKTSRHVIEHYLMDLYKEQGGGRALELEEEEHRGKVRILTLPGQLDTYYYAQERYHQKWSSGGSFAHRQLGW